MGPDYVRAFGHLILQQVCFLRKVISRVINIILTMAMLCLPYRGHREKIQAGTCSGGNFLGLVSMQAKFDPVLKELLHLPNRAPKYLSPKIQNE